MDPRRKLLRRGAIVAGAVLFLVLYIDDWGRDFTHHDAATSAGSVDPGLRPFESGRTAEDLADAVRMAAGRIRNWDYVGQADAGPGRVELRFVRTQRLLRVRDDIVVRIDDRGDRRVVSAESRSRLELGDLGRNPRNLRRLNAELLGVLDGAVSYPVRSIGSAPSR